MSKKRELSRRALMALFQQGYSVKDRDRLRDEVTTGKVQITRWRNVGATTAREIWNWVEIVPLAITCPHCKNIIERPGWPQAI